MKLPEGMHTVMASFVSETRAEAALRELRDNGYDTVQIDRIGDFGVTNNACFDSPLHGGTTTLSGLTQLGGNTFDSRSEGILAGADVGASGMGGAAIADDNVLLTVVCPEDQADRAAQIVRRHGGQV
ncbi:MAG: hypothetical protein AB1331_06020 [Bacillota bacterium]